MTILVDTDQLKEVVASSASASANLAEASTILNQITQHQDWICDRKTAINTEIESIRSQISRLEEDSSAFNAAITQVTEDFVNAENEINKMVENLQEILAASGIYGSSTSVSSTGTSVEPISMSKGSGQ